MNESSIVIMKKMVKALGVQLCLKSGIPLMFCAILVMIG
jgi:hypothetical protein